MKWGIKDTARKKGPYSEILDCDIFINCIYLKKTKGKKNDLVFLNDKFINKNGGSDRRLKVIADVSCDPTSDDNPIDLKMYNRDTKLKDAILRVQYEYVSFLKQIYKLMKASGINPTWQSLR